MKKIGNKIIATLEEVKKMKGRSNIARLVSEQAKERGRKSENECQEAK
jgi:hypothetical protein